MADTKYIVKKDDSLWDISKQFLGDPSKWPTIYKHNNSAEIVKLTGKVITNEDVISVGQVLYIPDQEAANKPQNPQPVRYAHFKSKAQQYENFKNSVFMQGIAAPITKVKLDNISNIRLDSQKDREYALRIKLARKISNEKIQGFFTKIDNIPELAGSGVLYMNKDFTVIKVRATKRQDNLMVFLREVNQFDQMLTVANPASNRKVIMELVYAGLSCTSAALGYIAITAEGLATPVSFGATSLLIPITTAATLASSASCGVYAGRVINNASGNSAYNDYLDDNVVFGHVMTALDVISLAGSVASFKTGSTLIKQLSNKNMSKQALLQRWKAMPRADRKKLFKEILATKNRDLNNRQLKAILRSMDAPKIFSQSHIRKALIGELVGAIGSTFSVASSAADGTLNNIAVAFIADEQKG